MSDRAEPRMTTVLDDPIFADQEVRAFLEAAPRQLSYTDTELAAELVQRFGPNRAWSVAQIADYWRLAHPVRRGAASAIESERDIRAFLDDRLGRMTLSDLRAACVERFGDRAPSRTAIGRYWQRQRALLGNA